MLDSYENRKGYMLAFGLTVNSIISVIFGTNAELFGADLTAQIDTVLKEHAFLSSKFTLFPSQHTTSKQRHVNVILNVLTSFQRPYEVVLTLCAGWV